MNKYYICSECKSVFKNIKRLPDDLSKGSNKDKLIVRTHEYVHCNCCCGKDCSLLPENSMEWYDLLYEN